MEFSIFNFVVVHNRNLPRGFTEIHEVDISEKELSGGVKITSLMRFSRLAEV